MQYENNIDLLTVHIVGYCHALQLEAWAPDHIHTPFSGHKSPNVQKCSDHGFNTQVTSLLAHFTITAAISLQFNFTQADLVEWLALKPHKMRRAYFITALKATTC